MGESTNLGGEGGCGRGKRGRKRKGKRPGWDLEPSCSEWTVMVFLHILYIFAHALRRLVDSGC